MFLKNLSAKIVIDLKEVNKNLINDKSEIQDVKANKRCNYDKFCNDAVTNTIANNNKAVNKEIAIRVYYHNYTQINFYPILTLQEYVQVKYSKNFFFEHHHSNNGNNNEIQHASRFVTGNHTKIH